MIQLNKYFDHTLLKADATKDQILKICQEAIEYDFASVCVNSCHAKMCADILGKSDVKLAVVVGFPLGAMSADAKEAETAKALSEGADEIDTVINVGALKDRDYMSILKELKTLANLCHDNGAILKVIIETCLLSEDEKVAACELVTESGADFIKTSTGFSTGGATLEDIALMKENIGSNVKIKASGGIRTLEDALKFIDAGASRLGCSASLGIMQETIKK